jgi:3-mercaptopyruvate sulfurtransferase SseA
VAFLFASQQVSEDIFISQQGDVDNDQRLPALPALLVSPHWLAQRLENLMLHLLDVREAAAYKEGHIPGAVQVSLPSLNSGRSPGL